MRLKTAACVSRSWIRMSLCKLEAVAYYVVGGGPDGARVASSEWASSGMGAVKGWCTASQRFSSLFHSTRGGSITQAKAITCRPSDPSCEPCRCAVAQHVAGRIGGVGDYEHEVAGTAPVAETMALVSAGVRNLAAGERTCHLDSPSVFSAFDGHPDEALGAVALGGFG